MKREALLKEMKESVGTKDPIEFFGKLTDVFTVLFDQIDQLNSKLGRVQLQLALAIQWDPKIASDMIAKQVTILRSDKDKDMYATEIDALKKAFGEDKVTQTYVGFCEFWQETLGYHPFQE